MSPPRWFAPGLVVIGLSMAVAAEARFRCDPPEPLRPQTVAASNCVYEVVLNDGLVQGWGAFTVATGPEHPVTRALGGRQSAGVARGFSLLPQTNAISVRSWTSRTDYFFDTPPPFAPVLLEDGGFTCTFSRDLQRPEVRKVLRDDGQPVGLEARFSLDDRGDDLDLVIRAVARGDTYEDSAVEVTSTVTNRGVEEARIGFRYAWVPGILRSATAALGFVPPDPPDEPWEGNEAEWLAPGFDHMHVSWTTIPSTHDPLYFSGVSVHGPWSLRPPPTAPDRMLTSVDVRSPDPALKAGPFNTCFGWNVPVPPRGYGLYIEGGVEAMAYYWADTEGSAFVLPPGGSASVTVWYWAFLDKPITCDAGDARGPLECMGAATPAVLDGRRSRTDSGALPLLRWSSPDAAVTFDDATAATPTAGMPGVGIHAVRLDVGSGPFTATCSTSVEVVDTTPPTLRLPPPVVLRTSEFVRQACRLPATLVAEAVDLCSPDVTITHVTEPFIGSGGAVAAHDFPPGTTRLAFTAVDPSGNAVTAETTVTVIDDTPPWFVTLAAEPPVLWPPNHRLVDVAVTALAEDNCDAPVDVRLVEVVSSEPDNDHGDGNTEWDAQAVPGADFAFRLRAERDGRGPGRSYTIRYVARDAQGNEVFRQTQVVVPHDQRNWSLGR